MATLLVVLSGCGEDPPNVVRMPNRIVCGGPMPTDGGMDGGAMDAAAMVGDAGEICDENEICYQNRCAARCTTDSNCPSGQMCTAELICVPAAMIFDSAVVDASDARMDATRDVGPDMCVGVFCASGACLPRLGVCVQCSESAQCSGAAPICNIARASCAAFTPRICGPCTTDLECAGVIVDGTEAKCIDRYDTFERICATPCPADRACPVGFICHSDLYVCVPKSSCEQFNAANDNRACSADTECAPLGLPPTAGSCNGGGMPGVQGTCRLSCQFNGDCPGGRMCTGGFCG